MVFCNKLTRNSKGALSGLKERPGCFYRKKRRRRRPMSNLEKEGRKTGKRDTGRLKSRPKYTMISHLLTMRV